MKIQVRQSEIAKASKMLKGLISKETLSDFSYVKLEGCGVNITLKGGDCDIQLTCRFGGDTDENGIVLVPGRFLNSFVGVSSGIVDLQTNGTKLKMKSNGNTFNMGIAPDKGYFDINTSLRKTYLFTSRCFLPVCGIIRTQNRTKSTSGSPSTFRRRRPKS